MELNKEALAAATKLAPSIPVTVVEVIKAYLEYIEAQKAPKPVPFDPEKVKPGDALLLKLCGTDMTVKYIGQSSTGSVVVEGKAGNVQVCSASELTIQPSPRKVVGVAVFLDTSKNSKAAWINIGPSGDEWRQISDWVEIEINEEGEV